MFDQMIAAEKQTKGWALMCSATMQTAFVAGAVLVSVIQVQTLDLRSLVYTPPLLPPSRQEVRLVSTENAGSGPARITGAPAKVFTAPVRTPPAPAQIVDDPAAFAAPPTVGVVGSIPGGDPNGVVGSIAAFSAHHAAPPPAAPPKAHAQAAPPPILRVGGNVLAARKIHDVMPVYPPIARAVRVSGVVKLLGIIDRFGAVRELKVIEGHPLLIQAAVDAVREWRYQPTLLNNEPVDVVAPIEVRFVLAN